MPDDELVLESRSISNPGKRAKKKMSREQQKLAHLLDALSPRQADGGEGASVEH